VAGTAIQRNHETSFSITTPSGPTTPALGHPWPSGLSFLKLHPRNTQDNNHKALQNISGDDSLIAFYIQLFEAEFLLN
jgi:hypothetical protein